MIRSSLLGLALAIGCGGPAETGPGTTPEPSAGWRQVRVVTHVEVKDPSGVTRAWIPVPRTEETDHQRAEAPTWEGNATVTELHVDPVTGAELVYAEWPETETAPVLTVTSLVETLDRAVDLSAPSGSVEPLSAADRELYTSATSMLPTDGIVYDTAMQIAGDQPDDVAKARAIYEWIVDNSYRDPDTQGCGTGDIVDMLESGDLGGKCVDLNALFVGLARSLDIPARHDYGVRVVESATYDALGKEGDITKGQHCRAEFWAEGHGWVPVDPADVRKLILEEDGGLDPSDPVIQQAREDFFGTAEMNWVVYNHAEDVALPESSFELPFLMYPQIQIGDALCNCYLPESCSYGISSEVL